VTITIKNQDTGGVREVITNNVGFYSAPYLAIGRYTVTAKLDGFQRGPRGDSGLAERHARPQFQQKPSGVAESSP